MSFTKAGKRPLKNALFAELTPDRLRALVLDYLCDNCYTATARAFARDSTIKHLDPDGDEIMDSEKGGSDGALNRTNEMLRLAGLRQQIQTHILSGRVDEATELLKEHFPLVLDETGSQTPEFTSPSASTSERVEYASPTSMDPAHLSLNLRILSFTEASRTVPLEYVPHSQERSGEPMSTPPAISEEQSPIHELHDTEAKQIELLCRAQNLYSAANSLKNPNDRATYREELGNVGALLAYKRPEESPMARYLSQERREAVANQINSAILYRTGRPTVSDLEVFTRYTSAIWNKMHELQMKPPPVAKRPVPLPPSNRNKTAHPLSSKEDLDNKDFAELIPPFDLRQFLDSKH